MGCLACRLISQLTAILDQVSSSTAAAAVAVSDIELAAVAAASRLAIFFPQTHLLTLSQTALSCNEPEAASDSSIESSNQSCMVKLGLDLAEALITTWTEKTDEELHRGTVPEGEDWDKGSGAAWSHIIKGLLRLALVRGAAASSSAETEVDVLLLKALQTNHALAFDRYFLSPS